eukprot:PhF_6_TR29045/c0_g1_i1/m.42285
MDDATAPDLEKKIDELSKKLSAAGIAVPYGFKGDEAETRQTLKKFLLARQCDVEKAFGMVKSTVEFRNERKLNGLALFPTPPNYMRGYDEADCQAVLGLPTREHSEIDGAMAALSTSYAGCWHKWDKKNRPVFIERTGAIDVKRLVETLQRIVKPGEDYKAPAINAHLYSNELGGGLMKYQRLRCNDNNICQVTVIMDCENLGFGHLFKPALAVLQAMSEMDQAYYPEGLHRLFLVNCPKMISFAFALVRPWLDARVLKKIIFAKPHETAAKLLEEIDADCLPKHLGGKCTCEGGCVTMPTGELPDAEADAAVTQRIPIAAGQVSTKYFPMTKGQVVSWEFCTEAHNIQFAAAYGSHNVFPMKKVDCCKEPIQGSYSAPEDGVLSLTFDNTYSWMNAKLILLRLVLL